MGRVKSALIKRTAKNLLKEENKFTHKFEDDKHLLGNLMPSKRLRNKIAGYIGRLKQQEADRETEKKRNEEQIIETS